MKRFIFIFTVFALILCACGTGNTSAPTLAPTETPLPVIQLDVEHMLNPTLAYEIPAGAGFILDASGFDFGITGGPTSVQIKLNGHLYMGTWTSGETVQTIRAPSLLPPAGFKPLTDFPADKQLIVAVGRISANSQFEPLWVAVVNVR